MNAEQDPTYLAPYLRVARKHGGAFESLLWASAQTQEARFAAILELEEPTGQTMLDVGCGRADLLDYCIKRGKRPSEYFGLEAVDVLADAAEQKRHTDARILRADFIAQPIKMFICAEIMVISGSLNTLDTRNFYATIRTAFAATAKTVVFNFLCSPMLAAAPYLTWHRPRDVLDFARSLTQNVRTLDDYLPGDMTVSMTKVED